MTGREQTFAHPSQLNSLSVLPFLRTSGVGTLRLGGSIAEHPEKKQWESELNRHYYACGCDAGAIGLLIGLLAGGAWAGYAYFQGMWGGGIAVGATLSIAVVGATMGKLFGLFRANERLKLTIRRIQSQWHPEESAEKDHWFCG